MLFHRSVQLTILICLNYNKWVISEYEVFSSDYFSDSLNFQKQGSSSKVRKQLQVVQDMFSSTKYPKS